MSVVMVVAPILSASWPLLTTAACSAAASVGFSIVKSAKEEQKTSKEEMIEIPMENSDVLKDKLQDDKQIVFTKDGISVTFFSTERGKCSVRVCGEGKSKALLEKTGRDLMHKITQQYVYNKVLTDLKKKGYTVAMEEMTEKKSVRVVVRRFS